MKEYFLQTDNSDGLGYQAMKNMLKNALAPYTKIKKALIIPPDISRLNSYAGEISQMITELLPTTKFDILPALGTHLPMTKSEIHRMYPALEHFKFIEHNWRTDVKKLGEIPAEYVKEVSENFMDSAVDVEVNKNILNKAYGMIFSIGQVVPHEVVGMANFNKNIFVGCGGSSMINSSHYLGALYGMERMMGRDNTPVHKLFDYAEKNYLQEVPIMYLLTVTSSSNGNLVVNSLSSGRSRNVFKEAILSSQNNNLNFLNKPITKAVVYLDPDEFRTTWVGNKAIYRTRMAMADNGHLVILAPGIKGFGKDPINDKLIRNYGYFGRDTTLKNTAENEDLRDNLSVAAHLIHGSSEGRFKITYATDKLTKTEIEDVGFQHASYLQMLDTFDINHLKDGYNTVNGEEIFYISNPAIGLWAEKERFYSQH